MAGSDGQTQNARLSIYDSLESGSNVTDESDIQTAKQLWQTRSVEEGMQMDESEKQLRNAESPSTNSFEPDSNVTDAGDERPVK
jgi:hypothetical protein